MKYEISQYIDSGADANVYVGYQFINGLKNKMVAIKRYLYSDNNFLNSNLFRELSVLKKANSSLIVQFLDLYYDDSYIYVVMEFIDNNILDEIMKKKSNDQNKFMLT